MAGCPLPSAGDDTIRAICLPDTWLGLVSNLLTLPTELSFWDDSATLEDREAVQQIAATIVGTFQSEDCQCGMPPGDYTQGYWDFTQSDGGWSPLGSNYGTYDDGAWHADIVQINANRWDARLAIEYEFGSPVVPREMKAVCYVLDEATTHISASYAFVHALDAYTIALGEVQYGGDLLGWHTGPMNPRFIVYTEAGITRIRVEMTAQYALDPTGVIDLRCTEVYFNYFA